MATTAIIPTSAARAASSDKFVILSPTKRQNLVVLVDPETAVSLLPFFKCYWEEVIGSDLIVIPEADRISTKREVLKLYAKLNSAVKKVYEKPAEHPIAAGRMNELRGNAFANALQASVLADVAFGVEVESDRPLYVRGNRTEQYGELESSCFANILAGLGRATSLADIGMGAGKLVLTAAAMGFEATGVEIVDARFETAERVRSSFECLFLAVFPQLPPIRMIRGSIYDETNQALVRRHKIVFVNNLVFDSSLNTAIEMDVLMKMAGGTTVISSTNFGTSVRENSSRVLNRRTVEYFTSYFTVTEIKLEDAVTWTDKTVTFFQSVKKSDAERKRLLRDLEKREKMIRNRRST